LRAGIVVTGSELVRGERTDRNGPYLAQSLLAAGVEPAELRIVGDTPSELERAIRDGLTRDLLVTSGGLGPTHDDRTVELLAAAAGLPLRLDAGLAATIEARSRAVADRLRLPYADFADGVRKQATIPEGALVAGIAGTAPALVLQVAGCVAVTLPGPPPELRTCWQAALASEPLRRLLARATPPARHVLRFYGVAESSVAQALAAAGGDGEGVEATICARESEIHVDLLVAPGADERGAALAAALAGSLSEFLYTRSEEPIEALVLAACRARGLTLATAESCTGGLVAGRLTAVPGSSEVFRGAVVAYADEVKETELGVPAGVLAAHGAVSAETASAMAQGARSRLRADVAVSVTGIAGPGGGTPEKPVGLVYLCAAGPAGELARTFVVPADRETVRGRATVAALHLVRRLVTET
jgi:nicotinamide-nucleotide amidase